MKSYSDEGLVVTTMNDTIINTSFTIRLARTNFYFIGWHQTIESFSSTNNIQTQAVWSSGAGNFLEVGCGPQDEESREVALAEASDLSSGAAGTIPRTFFDIQWGDQGNQLGDFGFCENRQTDEKVGDVDCYVFNRELQGRKTILWIGKQDFLIHQVRTVTSAEAMRTAMVKALKGNYDVNPFMQKFPHDFTSTETHMSIVVDKQLLRSDFVPLNRE